MSGAVPTDVRSPRSLSSEVVGYVDGATLQRGFVRAFAQACDDGVPAVLRNSMRAYRVGERKILLDDRTVRRERLGRELRGARQKFTNQLRAIEGEDDERLRDALLARARKSSQEIQVLERELAELEALPDAPPAAQFETGTDVLLSALTSLAESFRWSLEEHDAFRKIVPTLRMQRLADGTWQAQTSAWLPVEDGAAELSDITWSAAPPGIGVASMRGARLSSSTSSDVLSASGLRTALEQQTGVAPEAVRLLTVAPFPQLAHLVLHARTGSRLPDWVGKEWREPAFVAHIAAVYGAAPGTWHGRRHFGRRMPRAQAVVDCTADAGRLTLAGYRQVVPGVDANEMWVFARRVQMGVIPRGPVVDRVVEPDGSWALVNRVCRCGNPATIVLHAPEVTGSLMCECGLVMDAEPGSTADGVRFPGEYRDLRVPREHWMRDLRRTSGMRNDELTEVSGRQASILRALLEDPARTWLCKELAPYTGMSHQTCQWNLHQLRRREFVRSAGRPARFELVDIDDTRAVLARSWRRQNSPSADDEQ